MMRLYAELRWQDRDSRSDAPRMAFLDYDTDAVPVRGETWFHCGDWGGELIVRREFRIPAPAGCPVVTVVAHLTPEVMRHVVDDHGFTVEPPEDV